MAILVTNKKASTGARGPLKGPRGPLKGPRSPLKGPLKRTPGSFKRTPGTEKVAKILLEAGANTSIRNRDGKDVGSQHLSLRLVRKWDRYDLKIRPEKSTENRLAPENQLKIDSKLTQN